MGKNKEHLYAVIWMTIASCIYNLTGKADTSLETQGIQVQVSEEAYSLLLIQVAYRFHQGTRSWELQ